MTSDHSDRNDEQQADQDSFRWWKISFVFSVVVMLGLLIGAVPWVTFLLRPGWAEAFPDKAGLWGDSFGFVNAILSALAFAGVLITLWMQRRELQLQRDEMRLTRQELEMTRNEHRRVAKAQEESEKRLFLAAYMSALESLRQLSQWRMTSDPARHQNATYPIVEGLVIQSRVIHSLLAFVREVGPEITRLHPSLAAVGEKGSCVWKLEEFLSIQISIQTVLESHRGCSDDPASFEEAVNIARLQFDRLKAMKDYCGAHRHHIIDAILAKGHDPKWIAGDILSDQAEASDARKRYFTDLQKANKELLSFIMSMCYED